MARVTPGKSREQETHFGLYRTGAGGDQAIIVRRKVGEPTDYLHPTNKKLALQRALMGLASQHYSHLTPTQKAITRHQIAEVEYQRSHGPTDTKILLGRQLFIAQELRKLKATQKQLVLPYELCIVVTDEDLNPIEGELWLRYRKEDTWTDCGKEEIYPGNWLFSHVPRAKEPYQVYGEAAGYYDPELPETQTMSEQDILTYHYHKLCLISPVEKLYPIGDGDVIELTPVGAVFGCQATRYEDSTFYPSNGYLWGHFEGLYVTRGHDTLEAKQDLYHVSNLPYKPPNITKIVIWIKCSRTEYPYGSCATILLTHGQIYYGEAEGLGVGFEWYATSYEKNPYTGEPWTADEINTMQCGVWLSGVASWGQSACDQLYIDVYIPE